jgi:hypothetical protein
MLCPCHLEARRKNPCAGGSAQLAFSLFLFIVVLGPAIDTAASPNPAGPGTAPVASVSPTSLTFASQAVGSTSAAQTVTLTNTGTAALSISSIALTGANLSDFAQTNGCGAIVAAGAKCTISVTFKPAASGSRTAALALTDNASGSPQAVSLTGTGTAPIASVSPTSLAFASQAVGSTSAAQTLTLTNTGTAALSISSVALTGANPGDFAQTNGCGAIVAAGAKCTISVTFKPTASGTRAAAVHLTDNASGSPQAVSLTGTGTAPVANVSPASLAFASQAVGSTSAAQIVTLTNTGTAALSISSLALTGANPGDFAQTNGCGASVAAGARCSITVTFRPTASGTRTAAVHLTDNATGSPQAVSLTGTGVPPVVSLSPTSLIFGNEPVDTTSSPFAVTVKNTGNAALNITSTAISGANATDFTEDDSCSSSLAAGGNCTIAILFAPSARGTRTASLTVTDNAGSSPPPIPLSGTGTHDVILSWTSSTTAGVVGYYVYRGTISEGESEAPLNSTPISGTTFADANVTAGATYYYVVTAVAADDITQSGDSNEVRATVPSP